MIKYNKNRIITFLVYYQGQKYTKTYKAQIRFNNNITKIFINSERSNSIKILKGLRIVLDHGGIAGLVVLKNEIIRIFYISSES